MGPVNTDEILQVLTKPTSDVDEDSMEAGEGNKTLKKAFEKK